MKPRRPGTIRRKPPARAVLALAGVMAMGGSPSAFAGTFAAGACAAVPNSKTCVDSTPCKTDSTGVLVCLAGVPLPAGAISLPQTCWQYSYQYACGSPGTDTCTPYEQNSACSVVSSLCQDYTQPGNVCDAWNVTYQCMTQAATTTPQVNCTGGVFDASNFQTPSNPNKNFAQAALAQEIVRESQTYSKQGTEIFSGVSETCRKGYFGLQNCCKSSPAAQSNGAVVSTLLGAAGSVVKYAGEQAIDWASPYVFDAMFSSGFFTQGLANTISLWSNVTSIQTATSMVYADGSTTQLVNSLPTGTNVAGSGLSFSAYGFTYSATAPAAGSGLLGANTTLMGNSSSGFVSFNPYVFAAFVAVQLLQSMLSCSQEEQLLSIHKGASLSVYEHEDCTSSFFGICLQYTDTYCSFNSVLAKIINTQGKPQLGLPTSDCTGFTVAQVSQLDFTKIDFSEFITSVTANVQSNLPTSPAISAAYQPALQGTPGGSAQVGTMVTNSNAIGGVTSVPPPANPALPTYPKP